MKKLSFFAAAILGTAGLGWAAPAPRAKPVAASPIDAVLARLETEISGLETMSEESACPPTLANETLLADVSSAKSEPGFGGPDASLDLRLYYFCGAFTQGKPALCDELKKLDSPSSAAGSGNDWAARCRSALDKTAFAKAEISGAPGLASACRDFFTAQKFVRKDAIAAACATFAGGVSDAASACAKLSPFLADADAASSCAADVGALIGDPAACEGIREDYPKTACLGHAAYAKAARSKDSSACADSPYCRMMRSGKPESCEPFLDDVRRSACKARYLPEYVVARGRDISSRLDIAIAQLKASADPSMADDDRTEKALRLKMRWNALEASASAALTVRAAPEPAAESGTPQ